MDLPLLAGLLSSALFLLLCLSSLAFFCRRRTPVVDLERAPPAPKIDDEPKNNEAALRRFGWGEVESLTGHFAPSAVIGLGGFSTVYLARLSYSHAAVKVHRSSERLHRAFRQELNVLLRLRHPNIVRLFGYSDDRSDDGALVFEYVPGGTLHDLLHDGGPTVLPWARRARIARQVAAALEYLHEGCDPSVVHGDVKTANVLLDAKLEPKLCDFGSALMGFSAAVTRTVAEKNPMMGSPGYVDPHYIRTGLVSKKSDVYSFGVLLLEILTGAEAFCPETDRPLTAAVGPLLREGRAHEISVDPRLVGEYDLAEAAAVAELAARCVGEQPTLRPTMAEVLQSLRENVASSAGLGWVSTEDVDRPVR